MNKKLKALFFILFLTTILEGLFILKLYMQNPKIKLQGFHFFASSDFVQASGTWIPESFLERPNQAAIITCMLDRPKVDHRGDPYLGACNESRLEITPEWGGAIILNVVAHYSTIRVWDEREIIATNTAQCGESVLKVDLIHEQVTMTHTIPNNAECAWRERKGQTWRLLLGDGRKSS